MAIKISEKIREKLMHKHSVKDDEIQQCFANRTGGYLVDIREKHASNPKTQWFISETNCGRKLKIAFIQENGDVYIRTAFEPNETELRIYNKGAY